MKKEAKPNEMVYRTSLKGQFRGITAVIDLALKPLITPGLKLIAPLCMGDDYQRIELSYGIEGEKPIVKFSIPRDAQNMSAVEALIAIAEMLLKNIKGESHERTGS